MDVIYVSVLFYFKPIQFSIRINVDIFRIYIYFFILFYIFSRASTRIIYTRSKMTVLCSNSNRFKSKSFALFFQTIRISIYNSFNIIPYWFLRLFRASSRRFYYKIFSFALYNIRIRILEILFKLDSGKRESNMFLLRKLSVFSSI